MLAKMMTCRRPRDELLIAKSRADERMDANTCFTQGCDALFVLICVCVPRTDLDRGADRPKPLRLPQFPVARGHRLGGLLQGSILADVRTSAQKIRARASRDLRAKMSLRAYKKQELKEMCQKLRLDDEGLKNDLEDRLQNYLDQSGRPIEDVPELSDHFTDLPVSPSKARRVVSKSLALLNRCVFGRARATLCTTLGRQETDDTSEESDLETKATELLKPASRRFDQAVHDVEVSPSKVAQWAHDTKEQMFSTKNLPETLTRILPNSIGSMRSRLSQVATVAGISLVVEGAKLTRALVPNSYEVKVGGLGALTVPDLLVFLSVDEYWKPILTWMSFQIIPLIVAALFNFRAGTVPKRSRKAHGEGHAFDPVTFAVAKLLMVYLAFHTTVGSDLAWKELGLLQHVVGEETFFIGTAITLIYALYEASL